MGLPFVGIPLFGVMATFVGFWYMATYKGVVFETSLVAYSTIFVLALGLLGITYSVMSASWDPDVDGSTSGLKRSRENLIVREQMSTLSEKDVKDAIQALDKKEKKEEKKGMSSFDKMKKELE